MSLTERPLLLNRLMRLLSVEVGGGMTPLLAAERLAVFESLLPSFTFQNGPPSCKKLTTVSTKHWTKKLRKWKELSITYNHSRVTSSNGYDISTWNYAWADFLHLRLNLGNNIKSPHRIIIWTSSLFSGERGSILQKYWPITTLSEK